jgi:hypothetical protein
VVAKPLVKARKAAIAETTDVSFAFQVRENKKMLMRCLKKTIYAALVPAAVFCLSVTTYAQTICNDAGSSPADCNTIGCPVPPGTTVPCDLIVPPNATCTLDNVIVTGSVSVEQGGCLNPTGKLMVGGNVNAYQAACLSLGFGSEVVGNLSASGTTGNTPAHSFNFLCNSKVDGSVNIENSGAGAKWCIGYQGSPCDCAVGVTVGGSLTFDGNDGGGIIGNNTITGSLSCANNSPPPTCNGSSTSCNNNTASSKIGQCSSF